MAYSTVKCRGTDFEVDWNVVERLCMSYWRTYYQLRRNDTISMCESSWYNPFSWKMPEMQTLEVDWDGVRGSAQNACVADMLAYAGRASTSMPDIAREMKFRVEQTAVQRRAFTTMLKDIQSANIKAMNAAESDYTGLIEASRFVRDTSADIVAIGSTVATGGVGVALLGTSSSLKGFGKYQDTGQVGASVLYGAGSMLLGAFKVNGLKLTTAGEYTLIIAQGVLEGGTSWMAGDGFAQAITTGGLKVASTGAAHALFGRIIVKKVFSKLPVPFNIWSRMPPKEGYIARFSDEANAIAEKTAKNLSEKGVKAYAKALVSPPKVSQPTASQPTYFDEVPVEDVLLLNLAIVNMSKGIGQGW